MRSRAAILPVPGDPFMLAYWLHIYKEVWASEVDELIVVFNSPVEKSVHNFAEKLVNDCPNARFIDVEHQTDHGPAINLGLNMTTKQHIVLMEDDCYVFQKGLIDAYFGLIESKSNDIDAVGSQRGCTSNEVLQAAENKYGEQCKYNGYDDSGVGFWPTMFFCRAADLLRTDHNFGSKFWKKGSRIEPLKLTVSEDTAADTFVWASIQLRELGLKFATISSCHGRAEDLEHASSGENIFAGTCGYVHIGSLSSGLSGFLLDMEGRRLSDNQPATYPDYCNTDQEKLELERRIQWWLHCWRFVRDPLPGEFGRRYAEALTNCIEHYGLSPSRIEKRIMAYNRLMGGF